eukprot:Sspe_Gene.24785::Locus_9860_Transcript_2_2_Confidence_0.667_Length_8049::g.24785::m.24785/K10428/DCTN6; dynactin 6
MSHANIVCSTALVEGDVKFTGNANVLHPCARIRALKGPIEIGSGNIFEECCEIRNNLPPNEDGTPRTLVIGSHNLFQAGCQVRASRVGDGNDFNVRCCVKEGAEVGSDCIVGVRRVVSEDKKLADRTVVYGPNGEYRQYSEGQLNVSTHRQDHADLLASLQATIPRFHHQQ